MQSRISLSTAEAEYKALANGTRELLFVQNVLKDLKMEAQMEAYCDNLPATRVAKMSGTSKQTNHLRRWYFFVQDLVKSGELVVHHIDGKKQIADGLTKPLVKNANDTMKKCLLKDSSFGRVTKRKQV